MRGDVRILQSRTGLRHGGWVRVLFPDGLMSTDRTSLLTLGRRSSGRSVSAIAGDRDRVFRDAATAIGRDDIDALLRAMGQAIAPPCQAKHRLAAAAAIAASG